MLKGTFAFRKKTSGTNGLRVEVIDIDSLCVSIYNAGHSKIGETLFQPTKEWHTIAELRFCTIFAVTQVKVSTRKLPEEIGRKYSFVIREEEMFLWYFH
jgi:hypothetical protein